MPWAGCSGGLAATALLALLLLPAHYYVPEWGVGREGRAGAGEGARAAAGDGEPPSPPAPRPAAPPPAHAFDLVFFPTLDLVFTFTLLALGVLTYLCEWVQRKLMERRIVKLNQYLGASVERLRAWDVQQQQLEATLRTVQTATSEYNLLLYLLLRRHRVLRARHAAPRSHAFFDKELDDEPPPPVAAARA